MMKKSLFILLVMVPLMIMTAQVGNASVAPSHGLSQSLHNVPPGMQQAAFCIDSVAMVIQTNPPDSRSCETADMSRIVSGSELRILSLEKAEMPGSGMKIVQKDEEDEEEEGEDAEEDEEEEEEAEGWDRTWDAPKLA